MRRRLARVDAVLVQAVIAGALSFAHLHDLAHAAGQDGWKAWAYPISVDLLLVAAWHKIRTVGSTSAWSWFLIALTASLGANIATAGLLDLTDVPAWLRILVAGWPALAFLGGTLLAHTRTPDVVEEVGPGAPVADRIAVEQVTPDPEPLVELPAPEQPAPADPEPAPKPEPVAAPAPAAMPAALPSVPPALVHHARKLATDHETATGQRIDTDTLRARLGLPAPLAAALHAQLT